MQNKAEIYDFMGLRSKIGVCGEKIRLVGQLEILLLSN